MTFQKKQRVTFTRSHDRVHSLTGAVVEVKDDAVLVATDPDGVLVWANTADVAALPEEVAAAVDEKQDSSARSKARGK